MENKNTTIYEIKVTWACNEEIECTTTLYWDKDKARQAFREAVKQCVTEDCDEMFASKKEHIPYHGYVVEEDDYIFYVYEEGFAAGNFEQIELNEKVVY